MLVSGSGPHVIEHLKGRVESLTNALERAQDRINELERVFGSDAEILPLIAMGLTRSEAKAVYLLMNREMVSARQVMLAIYAQDPDQINEVNAYPNMKVFISNARRKLARIGVSIDTIGWGDGYRMMAHDKAKLAAHINSGAGRITRRAAE